MLAPVLGPARPTVRPRQHHTETAGAVTQITGGNFRLIERLMTQIARVMGINQLETITSEVVHAARQILVIGSH